MDSTPRPIDAPPPADDPAVRPFGLPLYLWVVIAVAAAIPVGLLLGLPAARVAGWPDPAVGLLRGVAVALDLVPRLLIRALGALAAPLVVLAILSAIVTNDVRGRQGARMMGYYLLNTLVAMTLGLVFSNLLDPGQGASLAPAADARAEPRLIDQLVPRPPDAGKPPATRTLVEVLTDLIPRSVGEALAQNNIAQLVILAVALAIGLLRIRDHERRLGETRHQAVIDLVTVGFELLMKVLLWVVALVPIAVFGVVAVSIARQGFELFLNLGWFIVAVLLGLACQVTWYLLQVATLGRVNPVRFLRSARDVMATTFSTASTAATMPVTLRALTTNLGLSRASSQLAACVGTNFNNDGTALYQASAALFIAQALGNDLPLGSQLVIMLSTLVASIGAGGIPSGSFVTLPLIFASVNLPPDKLPILLTVDWLLDRCRTSSNVLGDMTVAVLLERTEPSAPADAASGPITPPPAERA